ncbi:MAG TPA: fumarylacetoacetate hydrolase family protein [Candidatus Binatia bacterium]|nr:fumarylacetoacetate hydrolase family protein [Candidatus Binatia bacterium]
MTLDSASVLEGEREELRRILYEGRAVWVRADGEDLRLGDGRTIRASEAIHLPPCEPTKILAVHLNYPSRRIEFGVERGQSPTYFQKPTTALNSHGGAIPRPANVKYLNYEGELAVVIGSPMRGVAREDVWRHIAGFAPANDVGAQDFRDTDAGGMTRVKGMDGFSPIGPGLVRGVDVRHAPIRTYINGKVVQQGNISEMDFPIDYLLADLSRHITLLPGDVLLSGTPANSRPMENGDVVEVEIEGVGRLWNRVVEIPAPAHAVGHQPTDSTNVRAVALGHGRRGGMTQ